MLGLCKFFLAFYLLLLFAHEDEWMNDRTNERNVSICNCVCVCVPFAITSLWCFFRFCFIEWIEYLLIWDWDKLKASMNNARELINLVHFQTNSSSAVFYIINKIIENDDKKNRRNTHTRTHRQNNNVCNLMLYEWYTQYILCERNMLASNLRHFEIFWCRWWIENGNLIRGKINDFTQSGILVWHFEFDLHHNF